VLSDGPPPCHGPGRADVGGPTVGGLYALDVLPEVAGAGAGRLLHDTGLHWLAKRGFDQARLWVLRGNERAIDNRGQT